MIFHRDIHLLIICDRNRLRSAVKLVLAVIVGSIIIRVQVKATCLLSFDRGGSGAKWLKSCPSNIKQGIVDVLVHLLMLV